MPHSNTSGTKKLLSEKSIHLGFDVSLWLKGVFALGEIISGIATFFVSKNILVFAVLLLTQAEFAEDPHDSFANYLLHTAQNLSIGAQTFAAVYLLAHGVIKLWLIVGLLRQKLWYYPTAIAVFALFIVYQLYRFTFTHSILLLLITIIDAIVIMLTWHEWKYLRRGAKPIS
jgi:uncharacterized membrane protein